MIQRPYAKLRGLIFEKFGTQTEFAAAMEMHTATLNAKLNGRSEWTGPEIARACTLLGIPLADAHEFDFF